MRTGKGYDMAENTDAMVLRSLHLPQSTDDELRALAFVLRCSKADLIRTFINGGLEQLADRYGSDWGRWTPEDRAVVAKEVQARGASDSVNRGLRNDLARAAQTSV